jgi:hypothetical protein
MVTAEKLTQITATLNGREFGQIIAESPMPDLLQYIFEQMGNDRRITLVSSCLFAWRALGSPWVELRDRPRDRDMHSLLTEFCEAEPILTKELTLTALVCGMEEYKQLMEVTVFFYNSAKRIASERSQAN